MMNVLSPDDAYLLTLAARGQRDRDIAEQLGRSRSAVTNAILRAAKRLGARSRTQAVYIALSRGLIPPAP